MALYIIASIYVVWKWKNRLEDRIRIRQANLILSSLLFAIFFASLSDLIINSYFSKSFPQIAPLFILLPVWAMYYSIQHHDILKTNAVKKEEKILSDEQQKKIFGYFSISLVLAGFFLFIFAYSSIQSATVGNLAASLFKGASILSLGILMFLAQKIKKQEIREYLSFSILVASIPIFTFQFLNISAVTFWAYPLLVLMASFLFDKRFWLLMITISALITQLMVWLLNGEIYLEIGQESFIFRLLFLIVAFFLGSYTNKVYIAKVKENKKQAAFQKVVSDITFSFLTFNDENSDEKIQNLLKEIGEFFNVDRTYLFTIDHSNDTMTYSNEWCKADIQPERDSINEMPLDTFPWWIDELEKKQLIEISDVAAMPAEAIAEQRELESQQVKSSVTVPIIENDKIYAFIGIDAVKEYKNWSDEKIDLLYILANILANVLTPIQIDKQTKFMAYNDGLTKLPNRFLFINKVNEAIPLAKARGNSFAVLFIDLDGFKSINDTLGHSGGDIFLKKIAQEFTKKIREKDTVARFGGDEFLILLDDINRSETVNQFVHEIIKLFSNKFKIYDQEFKVTASVGIALYPADGEDSDSLIRNADIAMYHAKIQGKNQVVYSTKEIQENNLMKQELSNDLRQALARDEFVLYYQPQLDLSSNEITGVEALIRWMHPSKGLISPGIFIPLAERNNLIEDIDDWVLRTAASQNKKWQDMGLPPINMAINLSASQIKNKGIAKKIDQIIRETGLDPKYTELEITESAAIEKSRFVLNNLHAIQKNGFSISIDDFGTEYSSLSRLRIIPANQLKIDMQFVQGIERSIKDRAIIKTIIDLARNLKMTVIAEGVETKEQLILLKNENCDLVQGHYYYKAMPAEEIEKIL